MESVCPRCTCTWPLPDVAAGEATTGLGCGLAAATGADAGGAAGTGAGAATGCPGLNLTSVCGSRTMVLEGAGSGAWITGCPLATNAPGVSTRAEYSRTSRPCPQSTSTRKLTAATCTGSALVTRITARFWSSRATAKLSALTRPCGRGSPTRSNVVGDARRACSCSSSPGSVEMMGISASNGCPGCDFTRISPSPSAMAVLLSNSSTSPASRRRLRAPQYVRSCLITFLSPASCPSPFIPDGEYSLTRRILPIPPPPTRPPARR